MNRMLGASLLLAALLGGAAGAETVVVDDFEDGRNPNGWTLGVPSVIETSGGNPGRFLHPGVLDTFAPQPRTIFGAPDYSGDFRANGVASIGVDLITFSVPTAGGRPLTLILRHDNGTPGDLLDDFGAYFIGPDNIPFPGKGWKSYDFLVPSQEAELPSGWKMIDFSGAGDPAGTWDDVITDVARVQFFYGDPELLFIFQTWDLGLDNARITCVEPELFACADSGVNRGCGAAENVLLLNGATGGPGHVLSVATDEPLSLTIHEPNNRQFDGQPTNCCVYAWVGEPGEGDVVVVPKQLGTMCYGPFVITTKNPKRIWNSIGIPSKLGVDNAPGDPPVIPDTGVFELLDLPSGLGQSLSATFQGFVEDNCSQGTVPFSVTNGLVVRIQD